jgi:perosamine synthetase
MLHRFEEGMRALTQARHAIAVNSGTAALHLIVRGLGIGPGDEVVTTPFSFVASSNCVLFEGAVPRFVDIDPATLALDPDRIEAALTNRTRAILAVDVFGDPAPWPALSALAERHDLRLIDDACEAPGASIEGRPIGAWGDAAAFGFYPNKQITTGEGGCITTDDDGLATSCRSMSNQWRASAERMEHVRLGFNYRLDEMSAALGCAQLERLPDLLAARERIAAWYREALDPLATDLRLPTARRGTVRSWFVYVIQLDDDFDESARNLALNRLRANGIGCAPYFPSIHLQPYYQEQFGYKVGDFPHCEAVSNRSIALPFFPDLSEDEVHEVADALREILPQLPKRAKTLFR